MLENIGRFIKRLKSKSTTITASRGEEISLSKNDYGVVTVELSTIERAVNRAVTEIEGIEETSVTAETKAGTLKLRFTLKLTEGNPINSISSKLVSAVREELEKTFAILEVEIYVKVADVTQAEKKPKRRVR